MAATDAPDARRESLTDLGRDAAACVRCSLADARSSVVFGAGPLDAAVMAVGESPGFHEDRLGVPFAGPAGALLDGLLDSVGLARDDVYLATVLQCRPPGNRDPRDAEVAACEGWLFQQVALVRPLVVLALGSLATRVLSGRPDPVAAVRGRPQDVRIGDHAAVLLPLYDPAAAQYTPSMRETLAADVALVPELLARARGEEPPARVIPFPTPVAATPAPAQAAEQLGLF